MRSSSSFQKHAGIRLLLFCALVPSVGAPACAGAEGSGDTSLVIEVSQEEITVENQTGTPLTRGEISVIPYGTAARPYVMVLSHMSIGERRAFALSSFRNPDSTRFIRGVAKGRRVRVTATDVSGKAYEREVPFK